MHGAQAGQEERLLRQQAVQHLHRHQLQVLPRRHRRHRGAPRKDLQLQGESYVVCRMLYFIECILGTGWMDGWIRLRRTAFASVKGVLWSLPALDEIWTNLTYYNHGIHCVLEIHSVPPWVRLPGRITCLASKMSVPLDSGLH